MPAHLVVEVNYDDLGWTADYRRDVPGLLAAFGGRYVAKSLSPERLEGDGPDPDTLAILEFPSSEAVRAFLASSEYQPYLKARQAGARTRMYLIGD
jgi:uncharacterized protein (DUF1330 family)